MSSGRRERESRRWVVRVPGFSRSRENNREEDQLWWSSGLRLTTAVMSEVGKEVGGGTVEWRGEERGRGQRRRGRGLGSRETRSDLEILG
ncbi:hypothetical protein DVH24_016608 [Malus domestica]|uniref:Uncharacterized protein n=1 Tax=Malus domestica TaxID=3750 RepID=A0A498HQN8_MALDO|nr:hypothetical protein DVH24_016608 [Malus domestica]